MKVRNAAVVAVVVVVIIAAVWALAGRGGGATATPTTAATQAPAAAQTEAATLATESAALSASIEATSSAATVAAPEATGGTATASESAAPSSTATGTGEAEVVAAGVDIAGHWQGAITIQNQDLGIAIDFAATADGYAGTMDVPAQSAADLPLAAITYEPPAVRFEAFSGSRLAVFEGTLSGADTMSGSFAQAGYEGTFSLTRVAAAEAEPLAYAAEEVTFTNGDASLAGTLTIPEGDGPFPAVVLISGSGQQNRDAEIFGFKVFGVIADHLTGNGIAVLRYDDRGIGGSTGEVENATTEDFAGDVLAAVEYLSGRPEIDTRHIGLIGHSEGGVIAPMVANQSDKVAFVVLLAAPAMPGDDLLAEQARLIYEASGYSEAEIEEALAAQQEVLQALETGQGWEAIGTRTATDLRATVEAMPTEQRAALGDIDEVVSEGAAAQIAAANSAWMRYFVTYDPVPALQALSVPVLALYGTKDTQVSSASNGDALRAALDSGSSPDASVEVFMDANHLFQKAGTGSPDEYAALPGEFVPGFLDVISGWILDHAEATG